MRIRSLLAFLIFWMPAAAGALFTGNDQFDRARLNNEALLDREYFTNLLAYAPFWDPLPASVNPGAFARTSEGSLTGEKLFIRREIGVRGRFHEKSFWGYQLLQEEDLEQSFFYQFFEAQAPACGPLAFRFFGQPTAKKQDSDIGAGVVLESRAAVLTLDGTWVDFNFNGRNLGSQRDRRDLYNLRARVQTPAGSRWRGEASWEWDSPVEREFPDEGNAFGQKGATARASAKTGRWLLRTSWKREHRNLVDLSSGTVVQDFRRQAWMGDAGWFFKEGGRPVRFGIRVHRRAADFRDGAIPSNSTVQSRWEVDPYAAADWGLGKKCVLETGFYAALGRENLRALAAPADPRRYAEAKLKTGVRVDFNPDVSLLINPTWDADRLFTHRTFDGGNIQLRARMP